MMVVADTSPLNYLIQIGCESLLPQMYDRIIVPSGVLKELANAAAPPAVHAWLGRVPAWIEQCQAVSPPDETLAYLGLGEREAIQIAEEQHAHLLLIDDRKGRLEARQRGLKTTGTLGVLLSAGDLKLIDPSSAYRRLLVETTFRTSATLEAQFLSYTRPVS